MRVIALICSLFWMTPGMAETLTDPAGQITVSGEARVVATPDMAQLRVGAAGRGKDPVTAMTASAQILDAMMVRLREAGVGDRDIQTSALRLDAEQRWDRDREQNILLGYVASNDLTVRVRDLDQVGPVLAALLADGANRLSGLNWAVQDPHPLMAEARRRAIRDAMDKAALYAETAGVPLGHVIAISDVATPESMSMKRGGLVLAAVAEAADVPVAAGEIEISAQVTMVFAIAR